MMLAFDLVLCGLIVLAALAAVAGRGLFRAVVFFIVYGVMVALAWVRMGAPDVALAEAAIGAGLTGVLLLGAVARLTRPTDERAPEKADSPVLADWPVASLSLVLAGALGWAVMAIDPGAAPQDVVLPALIEAMPRAGVDNPVTAVLLNFRAWDTLLESIVLLAALVGIWPLARDGTWDAPAGLPQHARADGVLASFGRLLPPMGLIIGVYLVWAGSNQPGGAFQGGTVLAAAGLLAVMAGIVAAPALRLARWRVALTGGPAVFLAVGFWGLTQGSFLILPEAWAYPLILGIEAALTLSIAVTLALLVLGPPDHRPDTIGVAS